MRHAILTCKNHPTLRWSCKSIAMDENAKPGQPARYDGSRSIFFMGTPTGKGMYADGSGLECSEVIWKDQAAREADHIIQECDCHADQLIIAEEDALVKRDPPPPPPAPVVMPTDPVLLKELKDMLSTSGHSTIEVVRHLRHRTGLGLLEAHTIVQKMGG